MAWSEIVGYQVIDAQSGVPLGVIRGVDDATINTLFDVTTPDGDGLLIPANAELITEVDRKARRVTMNIPEGLLDLG